MSGLKLYTSYSFKDKDPIIDRMRTIIADANISYARIEELSGVSASTLYNWFDGEVKRPQFATLMAVARACDYELALVPRTRHADNVIPFRRKPAAARAVA